MAERYGNEHGNYWRKKRREKSGKRRKKGCEGRRGAEGKNKGQKTERTTRRRAVMKVVGESAGKSTIEKAEKRTKMRWGERKGKEEDTQEYDNKTRHNREVVKL